jgi:hypothetical protein
MNELDSSVASGSQSAILAAAPDYKVTVQIFNKRTKEVSRVTTRKNRFLENSKSMLLLTVNVSHCVWYFSFLQYPQKDLTGLLIPVTSVVYAVGCSNFFGGSYLYLDVVY